MQNGQEKHTQTGRLEYRTLLNKRYMILGTIGRGGMGAVYKAQDTKRQELCAIKEMSLSMVPLEERAQAVQNFETEARMLANLHHPNLPAFTGRFTEGSRHFLVMEYIDGLTLEDYLERNNGPFPELRVLGWARQLCDVLAYLHSQRPPIIFRDLKPGNIMLARNGRIKLIDFGIARFFRVAGAKDTQLLGTPGYAPPEQYGKAQTDARSDIYSLAMTLFHLMTDTLSEQGFGLKDVHEQFPQISLPVARALEKATALNPDDRFQNAEAFRRALFGEGTFLFEHGEQATTPEELAELCARYPEEAAGYLYSGEIEAWMEDIGNTSLARKAIHIRKVGDDPEKAVERFLQEVMGPHAHLRKYTVAQAAGTSRRESTWSASLRQSLDWFSHSRPSREIVVQPGSIDFGEVYQGVSEPMALSISGYKGAYVRGSIAATEPWILLDKTSFDGMSTVVHVRVDTTGLLGSVRYTGKILVTPESAGTLDSQEDDDEQDIVVRVQVGVLSLSGTGSQSSVGKSKSQSPGTLLEEDDQTLIAGTGRTAMNSRPGTSGSSNSQAASALPYGQARYDEYRAKYGPPGSGSSGAPGTWNQPQASLKQRPWLQRILMVSTAFMLASLFYVILAYMPQIAQGSLLSNNAWFIVLLAGMIPAATLGALVVNGSKSLRDILNRLCTGLCSALLVLGLAELIWRAILQLNIPPLQLFIMLLVAAIGASYGTSARVSERVLRVVTRTMRYLRRVTLTVAVVLGGILGFFLTIGFPFTLFTLVGILSGVVIAALLILRASYLVKQRYP